MQLIVIDGHMGSGKTVCMSLLASYFQKKSGCTLYSNFGLKGSKHFSSFSHFIDVTKQDSSIICLDESHIDLDTRDSLSNTVKFFTKMIFYLRKMRATIIMTTPLFRRLDNSVRGVTNLYCHMTKTNGPYYIYNFYDVDTGLRTCQKSIRKTAAHYIASQIFDTFEMVEPLEYPKKRDEFDQILHDLRVSNRQYLMSEGRAS